MFEKLKKLFEKPEEKKEDTKMSFDEIRDYYYKNVQEKHDKIIQESRILKKDSEIIMKEMLLDIENLKNKEVEEKRAKSSEGIKNKFCIKSENILKTIIEESEKMEISDFNEMEKYYFYLKRNIGKIDVSPKEVMHIKFFFKEDFTIIVKKINDINGKLLEIHKNLNSDFALKRTYIERKLEEIKHNQDMILNNMRILDELSEELRILEKKRSSIEFVDTSELDDVRKKHRKTETRLSYIRQQINSNFSGISRIFKRIYHGKEDDFIEGYIKSPYDAFMKDDEGKIGSVLIKTLVMIKDNKVDIDKKSIDKLETLIERMDELNDYKKEIKEIEKEEMLLKESEEFLSEKEEKNRLARKEIGNISKKMESCRQKENMLREAIEKAKSDIEEKKIDIATTVSRQLGKNIVLSE